VDEAALKARRVKVGSWISIRVVLLSGMGEEFEQPPGRVMVASNGHMLARLAGAIDQAFGRWDISHLHAFRFEDGTTFMPGGSEFDANVRDSKRTRLASLGLETGATFEYVFDLGDNWLHACTVEAADVDPWKEWGEPPPGPVPVWGWGALPDQCGRTTPDD